MIQDAEKYGHWLVPWHFDPSEWFGFVYRIRNLETDQHYIGKKQFLSTVKKRISGRKNKKIIRKPSNWKTYTGSCRTLNEHIAAQGIECFEFVIQSLHATKGSLYYEEVRKQIELDVLRAQLPNGQRKFYNGHIGAVKFIPPLLTLCEQAHRIN